MIFAKSALKGYCYLKSEAASCYLKSGVEACQNEKAADSFARISGFYVSGCGDRI
jgi:hypothetical protein